MNIYDTSHFKLTIGPFNYDTFDYLEFCLTLPDRKLLKVNIYINYITTYTKSFRKEHLP